MKWIDDKIRQILHEETVNRNSSLLNSVNTNLEELNKNLKSILNSGGDASGLARENLDLKKKLAKLEDPNE